MAENNQRAFSGLPLRVATGLALAALAVVLVLLTPLWLLTLVAAALAALGMWEYLRMTQPDAWSWDAWACVAALRASAAASIPPGRRTSAPPCGSGGCAWICCAASAVPAGLACVAMLSISLAQAWFEGDAATMRVSPALPSSRAVPAISERPEAC
mgnify:CR=1 FL=1